MKIEEKSELASQSQNEEASEWFLVNPRILVGLAGAIACYAWLFLAIGTTAFLPIESRSVDSIGVGPLWFVVGATCALAGTWLFSNGFSVHKVLHFSLAAICSFVGFFGLWAFKEQPSLIWSAFLLNGMGFGFLYTLYGEFVCIFFRGYIKAYVHGIFTCAAIACAGLLFAGVEESFFFALVFPLVAFVAYLAELFFFRLQDRPVVDKKESDGRHRVVWRSYLATATSGMAAGYALGCLLSIETVQPWAYYVVEILVVATCAFLLFDALRLKKVNETVTMRFFLPCAAIVVFPLLFVPDNLKFIFALLLLCGSLFPTTCSISAMCKHISLCDLSAIRAFSFGRLMSFLGVVLGMAVAFFGFSPLSQQAFGTIAPAASVVAFVLLVIFSASFVMTEDNYPDESRFRAARLKEGDPLLSAVPGIPIRKIESETVDGSGTSVEEASFQRPGNFYMKCEIVSKRYGLSHRQREVLSMLAKGRNADYITEKLIISSHTAKAHIYNIYQKTGVHSRQELMDLVENTDLHEVNLSDFSHSFDG